MLRSNDPSRSHYLLVDEMNERDMKHLEYIWDENYLNTPTVDGEKVREFMYLCSDVCITDEHERPEHFEGFELSVKDDVYELTWF